MMSPDELRALMRNIAIGASGTVAAALLAVFVLTLYINAKK